MLLAEYKDSDGNWQPAEPWTGTTKDASLTVNLEKYQGKTLHLRVVAVPAGGGTVQQSPYSVTSNEFIVVKRETAPTVSKVEFTNPTPTLDKFLNSLQVQFTVNSGSSHYVTGYLFKEKTDYDTVVNLVDAWNTANPNDKAAALKALQDQLAALLTNETETKAVCLIPEGSRTIGLPAETTGTAETTDKTVQYTLTPDKFAMQPQYGGWYLLPAVRTMTTVEGKACSVWTYCTTELKVPCIQLDTPIAVRGTSQYTGNAIISDAPDATSGTADTPVEVERVAVQWSADNLYTAADTMLANVYEVTVTPTTGNGNPYTLRITVQQKDEYQPDESGSPVLKTARGAVLKVEEKAADGTSYSELEAGADGSWVPHTTPTTLTGAILQDDSLLRYYTMQVQPMLQYDANTKTYSLILPDLAKVVYENPYDTTSSPLTPFTATVQITAKGENGFAAVQDSEPAVIDNPQQTN